MLLQENINSKTASGNKIREYLVKDTYEILENYVGD